MKKLMTVLALLALCAVPVMAADKIIDPYNSEGQGDIDVEITVEAIAEVFWGAPNGSAEVDLLVQNFRDPSAVVSRNLVCLGNVPMNVILQIDPALPKSLQLNVSTPSISSNLTGPKSVLFQTTAAGVETVGPSAFFSLPASQPGWSTNDTGNLDVYVPVNFQANSWDGVTPQGAHLTTLTATITTP